MPRTKSSARRLPYPLVPMPLEMSSEGGRLLSLIPIQTSVSYDVVVRGGGFDVPMEIQVEAINSYDEAFRALSKEDEEIIKRHFSGDESKILVAHKDSNIVISRKILRCLKPREWLNDDIFVPISMDLHWTLIVINMKGQTFQYLDSLKGYQSREYMNAMARYLVDEVKDKNNVHIDVSRWRLEFVEDLPVQSNVFDCGMFMLKYMDFYSRGMDLYFSHEDMPYFRLRTAKEILQLKAE